MKLIDLSKSKQEQKEEKQAMKSPELAHDYHYGTKIHFEKGHIEKLGIGHLNVGDEVTLQAKAKVVSRSIHEQEGQGSHHMELQMTHAAVGGKDDLDDKEPSMKEYAAKRKAEMRE